MKVLGASISAPDEENPFSTVERGFSSELVYFSAKFKKLRTQGTARKKPSSKKAIFWEKMGLRKSKQGGKRTTVAIIESLKAASGLREGKILSLMQASMPPLVSGSTIAYYTGTSGYEYV